MLSVVSHAAAMLEGASLIRLLLAALALVAASPLATAQAPDPNQAALARIYKPPLPGGKVRTYYLAAEEVDWDYAPAGRDEMMGHDFMDEAKVFVERKDGRPGRVHRKAVYVEYADDKFEKPKPRPREWAHLGMMGPVLRAEVGDVIRVIFKNKASRPYSLHPHGVFYLKADEGAPSNDGKTPLEKKGDAVEPGAVQIYVWPVPERSGPDPRDPSSLVWLYHSHTDRVKDTNAGLIGPIIVTRRGMARSPADLRPRDVDREFVTLWKIFDESKSWYIEDDVKRAGGTLEKILKDAGFKEGNKKHAVNGYIFGNLPLETMEMRAGERVRWYTVALGNEVDLHTPHWHGHTVLVAGQRMDVVPLLPAQHVVADMVPDSPGIWMIHCHVDDHLDAGMSARYRVLPRGASPSVAAPARKPAAPAHAHR
jgi:hephaestin